MFEILFVLAVALTTGYQAGKAGQKQIAIENGGYCVLKTIETSSCYEVVPAKTQEKIAKLKEKE